VNKQKIYLSPPHLSGSELKYIKDAFASGWVAPVGQQIDFFEAELEKVLKRNSKVVALNSGTAAIHLALVMLGVKNGDSVMIQSNTHIASANPIVYLGAKPIFIDSEKDTWNMEPELLETAIIAETKKGKKPKAIVVVHLYGMPAKMDEINAIAQKYDIPVIEDAAEALGSAYNGHKCGTLGDYGILSFNGNKIITTSGGGALVTKTIEDKQKAVFLATQARDDAPHYQHSQIGYNYRMSNIVAGIGCGQMEVLDDRVKARRANFDFYQKELGGLGFEFLQEPENVFTNRWLTTILTDAYETREKIRLALAKENIESRPLWKPMHLQPVFTNEIAYTNGISEDLFNRGLCLPSGSNLTDADRERIVKVIKRI